MKASELVALLNAEIEKYGDLEVKYNDSWGDLTPMDVKTYNAEGNTPSVINTATEIFIH